ncbi:MAG TPA: hypothetical protein VE736_02220 [Gaiellaceae bacterium]|nr:hypothetical protein [Gaiellaceae bacterium]
MQALVERDELVASLDQQVLSELVAPIHLEHQPAEVAKPILAHPKQRTALAAKDARVR